MTHAKALLVSFLIVIVLLAMYFSFRPPDEEEGRTFAATFTSVLTILTLGALVWYCQETYQIRRSSQQQLLASIAPLITAQWDGDRRRDVLRFKNVGPGPAIDVRFRLPPDLQPYHSPRKQLTQVRDVGPNETQIGDEEFEVRAIPVLSAEGGFADVPFRNALHVYSNRLILELEYRDASGRPISQQLVADETYNDGFRIENWTGGA